VNIAGSLAGIVAFGLASYFQTTPLVWFTVVVAIYYLLVGPPSRPQLACQVALLLVVGTTSYLAGPRQGRYRCILWSPYYKVTFNPLTGVIDTNNIGHQAMVPYPSGIGYALPHLLRRDTSHSAFEEVLVIGAGSGNDVQAALANGARHVDAVEIDPVLYEIGRDTHPDRPYSDPRVSVHLDDGRSFMRRTQGKYDLVVYALVDSLVLHSGYSSLRLESFLFTEEAFQEIRSCLKPGGVFVMYNYYRQGWLVGRVQNMAEKVFGAKPLVLSLPYQEKIGPHDPQPGVAMLLVGDADSRPLASLAERMATDRFYWVHNDLDKAASRTAFGPTPPGTGRADGSDWQRIGLTTVDTTGLTHLPRDDWPFLYLQSPIIPALNLRGILMLAGLSLAMLFFFAPVRTTRPNGPMFFLGAGFMLLETKGVVHMALLFGSTWVVNSIVFFAILLMILLSNFFVLLVKPKRLWPSYVLLTAALAVNVLLPMSYFLSLSGSLKLIASCLVVYVPVFFAGIIFATLFASSKQPDLDLGSNIGGAVLGGLSEYLSLILGFDYLILIAIAFYLLAAAFCLRRRLPFGPIATVTGTVEVR
jgi:SAM-dependent methyltransferase